MTWLSPERFTDAVDALPLVSVDLCVTDGQGRLLLGMRRNHPARGWWFTPGGRVRKNEPLAQAIDRVAQEELGSAAPMAARARLMGAWDHFYPDSAFAPAISTHYVNLPHWVALNAAEASALALPAGDAHGAQHAEWIWLPLAQAAVDDQVHPYVRNYVIWLSEHFMMC